MAGGRPTSRWMKEGQMGSNPVAPGSYGGWFKRRKPPASYPTTSHQHAIGDGGRRVGQNCRGKKGSEFFKCRSEQLQSLRRGG